MEKKSFSSFLFKVDRSKCNAIFTSTESFFGISIRHSPSLIISNYMPVERVSVLSVQNVTFQSLFFQF